MPGLVKGRHLRPSSSLFFCFACFLLSRYSSFRSSRRFRLPLTIAPHLATYICLVPRHRLPRICLPISDRSSLSPSTVSRSVSSQRILARLDRNFSLPSFELTGGTSLRHYGVFVGDMHQKLHWLKNGYHRPLKHPSGIYPPLFSVSLALIKLPQILGPL